MKRPTELAERRPLPITLVLRDDLQPLREAFANDDQSDAFLSDLFALMEEIGCSAEVDLTVATGGPSRAVRILVRGDNMPYPPELMMQVWQAVAPPGERSRIYRGQSIEPKGGFPDQWLTDYFREIASADSPDWSVALRFLRTLTVEVIRQEPSCLVNQQWLRSFAKGSKASAVVEAVGERDFATILRGLLRLGIYLTDREAVCSAISEAVDAGVPVIDIIEQVFDRLSPNRIEIRMRSETIAGLLQVPPFDKDISVFATTWDGEDRDKHEADRKRFRTVLEQTYADYGVRLPEVVWMPDPSVEDGQFAIAVGDRRGVPIQLFPPVNALVNATPSALELKGIESQPMMLAAARFPYAIVSTADAISLESEGYTTWTPRELVAAVLFAEVRSHLDVLFTLGSLEYRLAQLEESYPQLVATALYWFSVEDLTRLLRQLLKDNVSIRDLHGILERLIETEGELSSLDLVQFLRDGLGAQIVYQAAGRSNALVVYLLDAQLESWAQQSVGEETPDADGRWAESSQIARDAFWEEIVHVPITARLPAILTDASSRAPIRQLIARELPHVQVLAYSELHRAVNVMPVARIVAKNLV